MAAGFTGYCNDGYSNHYDDHNAETRKKFGRLYECYNDTFIDDEPYRNFSSSYPLDDINVRDSPPSSRGDALSVRETKLVSRGNIPYATPETRVYRRERSHSAPGRRSRMAMYVPVEKTAPALRRSKSTVFHKATEDLTQTRNDMESPFLAKHPALNQTSYEFFPMQRIRYSGRKNSSVDVNSNRNSSRYCDISETSMVSHPTGRRTPTSAKKSTTNLAVIPPNNRNVVQSEVPLLAKSPDNLEATQRHSPSKASWVHLPSQPVATESLWLSGVVLLVTGLASCVLCFYIFSKRGRTYYLDLGTISAFISIVLGFMGLRTTRWEWFPNRNYVSGFLILSGLNLIQCFFLGLLAIHWYPYGTPQADIATGAICGLSFLTLVLASIGLCTSTCCRNPPPDNRVAHCAAGFTV